MKKAYYLLILFLVSYPNYAQTKHTVIKGETIYSISKKYNVSSEDILKVNSDAKAGVKENMVLTIPKIIVKGKLADKKPLKFEYIVKPGETIYAISKKIGVSPKELFEWNPDAEKGISEGQVLYYFSKNEVKTVPVSANAAIPNKHIIQINDTKYSVSKKYGISIETLEKLNPEKGTEFEIGNEIRLKKGVELNLPKSVKNIVSAENIISHEVEPKETLYSISKKYNVSVEDIIAKNPSAKEGLIEGTLLILPKKSNIVVKKDSVLFKKEKVNLLETVNRTKERNLVLLMPFNINRIEKDSAKTKIEYLKTDKFLNITLDFYAGALKAIDSAKVLGLPINAKVYDAETSKYSSNVATIIKNNNFSNVDVVIGPFTNSFVETVGQLVDKKTAVISPLTNDMGAGETNVFYAMPNENIQKEKLMAYLQTKSDAIFAIHSSSKSKLSTYFSLNYPGVKSFYFNDKGLFDYTIFKTNLQKGKKNFVILDSDKIMQVISVVNNLLKLKKEFDVQLVVIERNDALDFEEIPSKNLAALQMLYPSAIRENESPEALNFAKTFKKENKVQPNQYATRGFDVTFDVILRMCQEEGFFTSAENQISEQIESQFNYSNNNNYGVYMMYYNSDLTIKQAQ